MPGRAGLEPRDVYSEDAVFMFHSRSKQGR